MTRDPSSAKIQQRLQDLCSWKKGKVSTVQRHEALTAAAAEMSQDRRHGCDRLQKVLGRPLRADPPTTSEIATSSLKEASSGTIIHV